MLLRLKLLLRNVKSILFICQGNICRSPFAQLFAKGCLPDFIEIFSCGYSTGIDAKSPEEAVSAAAKFKIDLSQIKSQSISNQLIEKADVIFVFDESGERTVIEKYPLKRNKVFYLSALRPGIPLIISDPYGGGLNNFTDTFQNIATCILEIKNIIQRV